MCGNWGFGGGSWGMGGFGWIIMLIVWALIIWGIVAIVRRIIDHGRDGNWREGPGRRNTSSLDILNERYAKGELTKAEYEEKKKDLGL